MYCIYIWNKYFSGAAEPADCFNRIYVTRFGKIDHVTIDISGNTDLKY